MSTPSNLYAEKIFSEHPIALWALDDQSDYISLIQESQRNLESWSIDNGMGTDISSDTSEFNFVPFSLSNVSRITGEIPSSDSNTITLISDDIANLSSLNASLGTFSIGSYFYAKNEQLLSIDIGYEYLDPSIGSIVQNTNNFPVTVSNSWFYLSETFSNVSINTNFRILIKINYSKRIDVSQTTDMYLFYTNGITVGQWAEEFQSLSLGQSPQSLPSSINLTTSKAIEAKAYGLQNLSGYYMVNGGAICARNSGMPLVYGASNATILSPNINEEPSLIIPGNGFLNNHGRYKEYTIEMWIRINSNSIEQRRIFGPIASQDGLYVDGPFITLKIGDSVGSYFIGEWYRPMLVHIEVIGDSASLLINGEQVISIAISTNTMDLPDQTVKAQGMIKNQDWLGFYSYSDVTPIEIDCVAIYPYQVPAIVAKRRFVYGQGVEFPENINTAYSGSSTFIDYAFSKYGNNYNYPDIGKWHQGVVDNLSTEKDILSLPKYELPDFVFSDTSKTFLADLELAQNEFYNFITLKPNNSWNDVGGHILFPSLGFLKQDVKAFYGVFKTKTNTEKQNLFVIENTINGDTFSISLYLDELLYELTSNGNTTNMYTSYGANIGETFVAGISIDSFSKSFGGKLASFFGNKKMLKVYVGGNKNFTNTFSGNIYKVGFCTERNLSTLSSLFSNTGTPIDYENVFNSFNHDTDYDATGNFFGDYDSPEDKAFWEYVIDGGSPSSFASYSAIDHNASYSLAMYDYFGKVRPDISISGYWEDYIPLTYFAKYVNDSRGNKVYDLDFIQFNINYPAPSKFIEQVTSGTWNYSQLLDQYSNPDIKTYSILDNQLITGYENYTDLKNKVTRSYKYDTSSSLIKTYITFQYLKDEANKLLSQFYISETPPKNGVIRPDSNWMNTKYEVVDNMIVYPPANVDLHKLAIVTHIEFDVNGSSTKPIKIKTLQYASQSFNQKSPNAIGTRFGNSIYPYTKSGLYFDYKAQNPFTIYKSSSPYLYLTKNSGIQIRGDHDPLVNRGLSIPINQTSAPSYKITALQAAIRYDEEFFPQSPMQIFEIQGKDSYIKFYVSSTHPHGKRAKIYAINANTGAIENGITFYWNGRLVKEPTITIAEWGMLGIGFASPIDFSSRPGAFRINGPILVNNVSSYQFTNLQELQQTALRKWLGVKISGQTTLDWQDWYPAYLWQGVLIVASKSFTGTNPSDVYKTYTGTNKIIIDDPRTLRFHGYKYNMYTNISWQSQTVTAV
jgi:hypothetical protein